MEDHDLSCVENVDYVVNDVVDVNCTVKQRRTCKRWMSDDSTSRRQQQPQFNWSGQWEKSCGDWYMSRR